MFTENLIRFFYVYKIYYIIVTKNKNFLKKIYAFVNIMCT